MAGKTTRKVERSLGNQPDKKAITKCINDLRKEANALTAMGARIVIMVDLPGGLKLAYGSSETIIDFMEHAKGVPTFEEDKKHIAFIVGELGKDQDQVAKDDDVLARDKGTAWASYIRSLGSTAEGMEAGTSGSP